MELMPQQQLDDFEIKLNQLQSCFDLSESDLFANAFCPHCDFKAISEVECAAETLAEISDTLEQLHNEWTEILLTELKAIKDSEQWALLQTENRALLEQFLTEETLPDEINYEFLEAVQESLSGLEKVAFNFNHFKKPLPKAVFLSPCQSYSGVLKGIYKPSPRANSRLISELCWNEQYENISSLNLFNLLILIDILYFTIVSAC